MRAERAWTRRAVLMTGVLGPMLGRGALADAAAPRVAALDWGLAATVAALGGGPAAVGEAAGYRHWVGEPALPGGVVELGLRIAPSFERLAALKPDLIAINALNGAMRERLETIAPTFASTIYAAARDPVGRSMATAHDLGARLGRAVQAEALVKGAERRFAAARDRLAGRPVRPLVPLGFIDGRHARVYGSGSLFAGVMARLGLTCGWTGPTNDWGFSVIAIEALAACGDAELLVIEPVPPEARRSIEVPGLWSSLVAANDARVITLPPVWAFGDISAAARCADLLAEALAPAAIPTAPIHG